MANLWLRTVDSMNEETSEEFVDATDQRDWPVVDDSVEAVMQARFRTSSMSDEDVHRNLMLLRRRYSSHPDDSVTTVGALSALSGESTRLGNNLLASSPSGRSHTASPIRLASLSPVTLARPDAPRSPSSAGNLTAAAAGLGVISEMPDSTDAGMDQAQWRAQLRAEMLTDLRQELFTEFQRRDKLLTDELVRVQQQNTVFRRRIHELESRHTTQDSQIRIGDPDLQSIEELTRLGEFTSEQARLALSSSNNNLEVAADLLLSSGLSPRIDESQQRPVLPRRGRGGYTGGYTPMRGNYTPQPFRSSPSPSTSGSGHNAMVPAAFSAASGQADREQLAPTLAKLADAVGSLSTLLTERNTGSTRDPKQRPLVSGHKFDTGKIVQYTGECAIGTTEEYWRRPGSWTKRFRNLMLSCAIPNSQWTHFALLCCGQAVLVPWETAFEKPSNAGPGWQSSHQLDIQDDGGEIPFARRQSWPEFVRWLASRFNIRALFEIQHENFKQLAQEPGERVHMYNVRWNLERELVDELAGAELYPVGSIHEEELENMYVRSLLNTFSSKLTDFRAIRGTLLQAGGDTRDTASEGGVSLGLTLLQNHAVQLDNAQFVASELRKWKSPHATTQATRTYPRKSFPFPSQRRNPQRITHLEAASRFSELEEEGADQSLCCQDLFFKLQTDGKVNWSPAQMKRLWADKCCFRCGLSGHQWADCKAKYPADPKAFHFANLVSTDCPDDDDTIPEDDEVRSYLQAVQAGHLN